MRHFLTCSSFHFACDRSGESAFEVASFSASADWLRQTGLNPQEAPMIAIAMRLTTPRLICRIIRSCASQAIPHLNHPRLSSTRLSWTNGNQNLAILLCTHTAVSDGLRYLFQQNRFDDIGIKPGNKRVWTLLPFTVVFLAIVQDRARLNPPPLFAWTVTRDTLIYT
jgi:hypothetical protein